MLSIPRIIICPNINNNKWFIKVIISKFGIHSINLIWEGDPLLWLKDQIIITINNFNTSKTISMPKMVLLKAHPAEIISPISFYHQNTTNFIRTQICRNRQEIWTTIIPNKIWQVPIMIKWRNKFLPTKTYTSKIIIMKWLHKHQSFPKKKSKCSKTLVSSKATTNNQNCKILRPNR